MPPSHQGPWAAVDLRSCPAPTRDTAVLLEQPPRTRHSVMPMRRCSAIAATLFNGLAQAKRYDSNHRSREAHMHLAIVAAATAILAVVAGILFARLVNHLG